MPILFGGDGSYMAPFSLQNDNILTSLMSQVGSLVNEKQFQQLNERLYRFFLIVLLSQLGSPTTWYRLVAGVNAQLRLVRRGRLRSTFHSVLRWLETHANPALETHGIRVDLAWFQTTACGYCQYGLLIHTVEDCEPTSPQCVSETTWTEIQPR